MATLPRTLFSRNGSRRYAKVSGRAPGAAYQIRVAGERAAEGRPGQDQAAPDAVRQAEQGREPAVRVLLGARERQQTRPRLTGPEWLTMSTTHRQASSAPHATRSTRKAVPGSSRRCSMTTAQPQPCSPSSNTRNMPERTFII